MVWINPREHLPFLFLIGVVCIAISAFAQENTRFGLPPQQQATRLESFDESALGDGFTQRMTPEALTAFRLMQAAAAEDRITIHSQVAYRSDEEQQRLFDQAVAQYGSEEEAAQHVAPPGYSRHRTGNAVDLRGASGGLLQSTGEDKATYDWLVANAGTYGFELSYPEGNTEGVAFEPWEWFYVGADTESLPLANEGPQDDPLTGQSEEDAANQIFSALLGEVASELATGLPLDYFVRMDIPFGQSSCEPQDNDCEEHGIDNTASGNWKNRSIPCPKDEDCSHIEVWRPSRSDKRVRWISGKDQWVDGGWGAGRAICRKEPTGRYPFGTSTIKLVLRDVRETEGRANFALYFAREIFGPFGIKIGETAACFGPFPMPPPFNEASEEDWTLFGLDNPDLDPLGIAARVLRRTIRGRSGGSASQPSQEEILANAEDCTGSEGTYIRPTTGTFTSPFGERWGRHHAGVDIANPIGTPIIASNCGVVDFNRWAGNLGNTISVLHPSGAVTLYAHMDSPGVIPVGQPVQRGQLLGYMGTTGRSTGPHLHFEFHPYGYGGPHTAENPENYVPGLR